MSSPRAAPGLAARRILAVRRRHPVASRRRAAMLIALAGLARAGMSTAAEPEFHPMPGVDGQRLPFSESVRVGDLLFLAGQVGNIPGTRRLADGGIAGETRQAMDNIAAALDRHGASTEDVVKCTVFLKDIDEWAAMNEVYVTYFPRHKPARSAVEVGGLALGARVEIECIAALGG